MGVVDEAFCILQGSDWRGGEKGGISAVRSEKGVWSECSLVEF